MTDRSWNEIDPVRAAAALSAPQLPRKFYKIVAIEAGEGGYRLLLDGMAARTPARKPLAVPTRVIADAIAAEWRAQDAVIDPASMAVTRAANTAIDGVADQMAAVADEVIRFSGSDLVCYRAESPEGLCDRQTQAWDPIVAWAKERFGRGPTLAAGILHVEQPAEIAAGVRAMIGELSPFALAGVYTITALTGSALIALAMLDGAMDPEAAWRAAHIDEDWQIEQWGEDEEAMARRATRRAEFDAAVLCLASNPA